MHILAVQISEYNARLNYIDSSTRIDQWDLQFNDKLDYRYKEYLNDYFLSEGIFKLKVDECVVSWFTPKSTLVPSGLFVESNANEIFKTSFGNDFIKSNVDFNRIANLNIVNIFTTPLWLKSFFVLKYPSAIIQHEGTHMLRYLSRNVKNKPSIQAILSIQDDFFSLIIFQNTELKAYLINSFNHEDDIVYHYGNAFQQLNLINLKGEICIFSGSEFTDEILKKVQKVLIELKLTPNMEILTDSLIIDKALGLCV